MPLTHLGRPSQARAGRDGAKSATLSRRALLRLVGSTAAAVLLARCAPKSREIPRPAGETISLVYQDWRTDWFPPMAQQALDQFHQAHPDIRVFYTPDPENVEERMLADMQAGTAPDVFQGCCTHFPIWAQQGKMLNLQPFVARDLDKQTIDDWDAAQYRYFFTSDGQQYALPKYHGALALYYNKDVFDKHGLPYPQRDWDYEAYAEAMRQLSEDQDGDGRRDLWGSMLDVSWDRLQVHANAWGGHFVDPGDARRCLMTEAPSMEALEWIRARMQDDKVMATLLDVQHMGTTQAFTAGKVAMVEDGSWALKAILTDASFRLGVTIMPKGPARRVTLATTDGFGIFRDTRYQEAAWELLKFLVSQDYGRAMARAHLLQPARASLVQEWLSFIREQFPEKTEDMDLTAFADGHINGYSVTTEIFANMIEAKELAYAAWARIFTLGDAGLSILGPVCQDIQKVQH